MISDLQNDQDDEYACYFEVDDDNLCHYLDEMAALIIYLIKKFLDAKFHIKFSF